MIAFLIKRLMHAVLVMFVISLLAFAIQDNLGDPVAQMVGQSVPESERQALRERLGLTDPFLVQYARFAKNAVQGDFG
ncbi:ABC transporter permease, partial [Halomonas sp. 707D4]|nr:ABC transporter permease [Halomonas sp. 707D4]